LQLPFSGRRRITLAVVCLLVIISASLVTINPVISADRVNVFTLQPYLKYSEFRWTAAVNFELDLEPLHNASAPFRCGGCSGCDTPAFECAGIPNVGTYDAIDEFEPQNPPGTIPPPPILAREHYKDGVTFHEAWELLHGIEAPLRQTTLGVGIADSGNDSSQVLLSGHVRAFLNETPLPEMEFYSSGGYGWNAGSTLEYIGMKDLTNESLTFLWLGSHTIHVTVGVEYTIYFRSGSSPNYLVARRLCVIERRLLNYLGVGQPGTRDCKFVDYYVPSIQI
jgi:hypothetical protein